MTLRFTFFLCQWLIILGQALSGLRVLALESINIDTFLPATAFRPAACCLQWSTDANLSAKTECLFLVLQCGTHFTTQPEFRCTPDGGLPPAHSCSLSASDEA
jgi:hypothetical protein